MIYTTRKGRVCSGEAIGILLLDTSVPFVPGDVANATTYDYPVRFKKVEGFTVEKALGLDDSIYPGLLRAAGDLVEQGVRAITGDCGFMALHQKRLAKDLGVPVFLSSLLQIPFMLSLLADESAVGIITANGKAITKELLEAVGVVKTDRLIFHGLEESPSFYDFAIAESTHLDAEAVEREVLDAGRKLATGEKNVGALLLECSLLPPYAKSLQDAVGLPVFDYITMIDHVFSAVVRKRYHGFI